MDVERRTQQSRKDETRRRLLEATLECLREVGYARTTTTAVVARAGVSQGALFKHFPTKSALLSAAAESLFESLVSTFEVALSEVRHDPGTPTIVTAVRELYRVFSSPSLFVVYKLYAEAESDAELRATLVPVVERHGENIRRLAVDLFPAIGESTVLPTALSVLVYAMQGMTLQRGVHLDPAEEARMLAAFEAVALTLLPSETPS